MSLLRRLLRRYTNQTPLPPSPTQPDPVEGEVLHAYQMSPETDPTYEAVEEREWLREYRDIVTGRGSKRSWLDA